MHQRPNDQFVDFGFDSKWRRRRRQRRNAFEIETVFFSWCLCCLHVLVTMSTMACNLIGKACGSVSVSVLRATEIRVAEMNFNYHFVCPRSNLEKRAQLWLWLSCSTLSWCRIMEISRINFLCCLEHSHPFSVAWIWTHQAARWRHSQRVDWNSFRPLKQCTIGIETLDRCVHVVPSHCLFNRPLPLGTTRSISIRFEFVRCVFFFPSVSVNHFDRLFEGMCLSYCWYFMYAVGPSSLSHSGWGN